MGKTSFLKKQPKNFISVPCWIFDDYKLLSIYCKGFLKGFGYGRNKDVDVEWLSKIRVKRGKRGIHRGMVKADWRGARLRALAREKTE